jgi:hypothetical protein
MYAVQSGALIVSRPQINTLQSAPLPTRLVKNINRVAMRATICAALIFPLLIRAALAGVLRPTVDWRNGRLSVEGAGASLVQVLTEVARQTGLSVQGADSLRHSTNTHFVNLPLNDALGQLLANVNFALVERRCGRNGRCLTLIILGERSPEMAAEHQQASAPQTESTVAADERLRQVYRAAENGDLDALQQAVSGDHDDATRAVALDLLGQKDPGTAAALALGAATSSDLGRRVMGLQELGSVDSPGAVKVLREALGDSDEGIRQTALAALAQQPSVAARHLIRQAAADADPIIRTLAENLLHSNTR